jgi:hypothetical protein
MRGALAGSPSGRLTLAPAASASAAFAAAASPFRRRAAHTRRAVMSPPRASAATAGAVAGAAAAGALGAWAAYYVLRVRAAPRVRAGPTPLNAALLARLASLQRPYTPPVWAFNGWVQARGGKCGALRSCAAHRTHACMRSPVSPLSCARFPRLPAADHLRVPPHAPAARHALPTRHTHNDRRRRGTHTHACKRGFATHACLQG